MRKLRRICVFCGASTGVRTPYEDAAREVGELLARRGIGLVYGGGNIGLMGVLSQAAMGAGAEVIGVIPEPLLKYEVGNTEITRLEVVRTMHRRKARMASLAGAFIAMPGGYGTFEELFEIITWSQLGLQRKPVGILNVEGYYDPLLSLVDHAVEEGFIARRHREIMVSESDPARLLDLLARHEVPHVHPRVDVQNELDADPSNGEGASREGAAGAMSQSGEAARDGAEAPRIKE